MYKANDFFRLRERVRLGIFGIFVGGLGWVWERGM